MDTSSKRIPQVNELVHTELSKLVAREVEFPLGTIVTITRVATDPEVKKSIISVSVLPEEVRNKGFKILRKSAGHLQYLLNRTLAMQHIPRIYFKMAGPDDEKIEISEQQSDIDALFDQLRKEKEAHPSTDPSV